MNTRDALRIVRAPFAMVDAFEEAKAHLLTLATPNQRSLFDSLPTEHKTNFLVALAAKKKPRSWQVLCWDNSMSDAAAGVANAMRFDTLAEANAYGRDLFGRWMGLRKWEPALSSDPVNYAWVIREGGYGEARPLSFTSNFKNAETFFRTLRKSKTSTKARLETLAPYKPCLNFVVQLREGDRILCTLNSENENLEMVKV